MDLSAWHIIWNIIKNTKFNNFTVILTTHSMEEADNLYDRLVILVMAGYHAMNHLII